MSLKEKFDKAGLTGTTVALPKGKIKDGSGGEKDYKTSKETKKLVKASQTKDAKVIKTPGALVKGASFANQAEKKKTRANTAADKVSGFAGSFLQAYRNHSHRQCRFQYEGRHRENLRQKRREGCQHELRRGGRGHFGNTQD